MRIGRTLPPAASPLSWRDLVSGLRGLVRGEGEVQRFSGELRQHFQCRHCFLVSSGKAALTLTLLALKAAHPGRDQVLIPALTCYSVPSAIVQAGLRVKLCDIDPATLDFDFRQLPGKLDDPQLLCVIPVHLFGLPADIGRLRGLITDPAVMVVEDAAQAMGGSSHGKLLGTLGDVGIFSLGRGKALATVEGGIILTDNDQLGKALGARVAALGHYSAAQTLVLALYALALSALTHPWLFWLPKAIPFLRLGETIFDPEFPLRKLTGLQAGLARHWRARLATLQSKRSAAVAQWLGRLPTGVSPARADNPLPLLRYPALLASAEEARQVLAAGGRDGLGIAPSYPDAVHRLPQLAAQFPGEDYPAARDVARRLVTLPVHGYVEVQDQKKIFTLLTRLEETRP
ncbi:MAG: DegT/DnrJ/EryC1/StrS family aminotransferase [Trichloromonadaceae bacterium]